MVLLKRTNALWLTVWADDIAVSKYCCCCCWIMDFLLMNIRSGIVVFGEILMNVVLGGGC